MTTDSRSERATSANETEATLPPERGHGETAASVAAPPAANKVQDLKQVVESEDSNQEDGTSSAEPPLPQDEVPPLPAEAPPTDAHDDGWAPVWDDNAQAYYFFNRFTGTSQWTNPRVPDELPQPGPPGVGKYNGLPDNAPRTEDPPPRRPYGGYDPSIHGDYDPTAPYAQEAQASEEATPGGLDPAAAYAATGAFNRFTGKWQAAALTPENFNDENKSKRQMSAFFDVDAAANSHNGKSLRAERSGKKLTKAELKAFKEKRKEKKEEKRRAWLRD